MLPELSILIPTMPSRQPYLDRIGAEFYTQLLGNEDQVEIIVDDSDTPLGTKNNLMLAQCRGKYAVVFDDDDLPAVGYLHAVLYAASYDPDVIGYWVRYYEDGKPQEMGFHTSRNSAYGQQPDCNGRMMYLRPITPKNVVRTSLAREVGFPNVGVYQGEDIDFALRLAPRIKSEIFIDGRVLYHYFFRNNKSGPPVFSEPDDFAEVCTTPEGVSGKVRTIHV